VSWVRFLVRAFPVARKINTIEQWRQDQSCLIRREDYRNKNNNPEQLSKVRFPLKIFSVARIPSTTEERRQNQSCLYRRGDCRNATTPKTVLGSSSDEECLCSSKTKRKRRKVPRKNLFFSESRLQELRSQTPILSWVRVSVKILGLGIIFSIIFKDMWPSGWHKRTQDESPNDRLTDADTRCHLLRRWA
jgi:hypothetical protein